MEYSLAKKLKDAGFPQRVVITHVGQEIASSNSDGSDLVMIPALEELIEACGDIGIRVINCKDTHAWCAWTREYPDGVYGIGNIPLEAVANLWLALNTK